MNKVKLFYSYCHADETTYRDELEKHLAILKRKGVIEEWHDRKISAGSEWDAKIDENMENSNVIMLLYSPDFIASDSCQKEVSKALKLRHEKGTTVIPIILRNCSWSDDTRVEKLLALPTDGKPVSTWDDKDDAWVDVFKGLKKIITDIQKKNLPIPKAEVMQNIRSNNIIDGHIDEVFVYPDLLNINKTRDIKLEDNEVNSIKLNQIEELKNNYYLIEGEEQCGKSTLGKMLFLSFVDQKLLPILLNGSDIKGKPNLAKLIEKTFKDYYDSPLKFFEYEPIQKILIIDDIDEHNLNDRNMDEFINSALETFDFIFIFIDEVSKLSKQSTDFDFFERFEKYRILEFGHKKRDELIRKCIAQSEGEEFNFENSNHISKLDTDTKHINAVIGSNIIPSYPVFLVTIYHTVESAAPRDMSQTSYGHCYHAIITIKLSKIGLSADNINACFNFLTQFAYHLFVKNIKTISENDFNDFIDDYENNYYLVPKIKEKLLNATIIHSVNGEYKFHYIYIFYYFVGKYFSDNLQKDELKKQVDMLLNDVDKKDNSNIIVFIAHHSKDLNFLDNIIIETMSIFEDFPESTLSDNSKNIVNSISDNIDYNRIIDESNYPGLSREKHLSYKDKSDSELSVRAQHEKEIENNGSELLKNIRKAARCMEIIGQILKNQYGTFEKRKLRQLFEVAQGAGLRLLKSFILFMENDSKDLENVIRKALDNELESKNKNLSKAQVDRTINKIIADLSFGVIFGWLNKIVDCIGYSKTLSIADQVNEKIDSVASKLINISIHLWDGKNLDIDKLKTLYRDFEQDKNFVAISYLKYVVVRHIYMHKVGFQEKQAIKSLFGFSVSKQIMAQKKLTD